MAYSFITLSPSQVEERRKQLDQAGFYGWLSPIVLLLGVYIYRKLLKPLLSQSANRTGKLPTQIELTARRVSWIVNTTYIPEFGPLHVQLTGLVYVIWLLYLVFRNTGEDYMHLTKAFGHVAISQLPVHYLLSFKSSRSPIALMTGLTHEKLNAYHRILGRITHGLLAAHAILYMRFFVMLDLLSKRIKDRDVRLGLAAFWAFNILSVLAIPVIRKKLYHKLFYRSHVVLSAVVIPILFFHVPYTRKYLLQAGIFWLVGGMTRGKATDKARVRCQQISGTELIKVDIAVKKGSAFAATIPGQHVYIQSRAFGPKNPFTVVAVSPSDGEKTEHDLSLVVRNLGGPHTAFLSRLATTSTDQSQHETSIEGPYGESSQYMPPLLASIRGSGNNGQILLVAGGVGATYTLPIYLALLDARRGTTGISLIWFVRTLEDATWGIELLENVRGDIHVDLYVTKKRTVRSDPAAPNVQGKGLDIHELTTRPKLSPIIDTTLSQPSKSSSPSRNSVISSSKRTDDPRKVKRTYDKLTVLLCGPPALSRDVRKEVGRHVLEYGRDVEWFEEQFGFGGS